MSTRIPAVHFEHALPPERGQQVRIDHTSCPAGVDTKKRLYILNTNGIKWVAYCHNCNGWGALETKGDKWKLYSMSARRTLEEVGKPEQEPTDLIGIHDSVKWPKECREWVYKHLEMPAFHDLFLFYSPSMNRVVLAITDGKNSFWQARDCTGTSDLKYYSGKNQSKDSIVLHALRPEHNTLVITEDIMSALRITECGVDATPLLGTTPSNFPYLCEVAKGYKKVVIWLDSDEAGYKGSNELYSRMQLQGIPVVKVRHILEPKTSTSAHIDIVCKG